VLTLSNLTPALFPTYFVLPWAFEVNDEDDQILDYLSKNTPIGVHRLWLRVKTDFGFYDYAQVNARYLNADHAMTRAPGQTLGLWYHDIPTNEARCRPSLSYRFEVKVRRLLNTEIKDGKIINHYGPSEEAVLPGGSVIAWEGLPMAWHPLSLRIAKDVDWRRFKRPVRSSPAPLQYAAAFKAAAHGYGGLCLEFGTHSSLSTNELIQLGYHDPAARKFGMGYASTPMEPGDSWYLESAWDSAFALWNYTGGDVTCNSISLQQGSGTAAEWKIVREWNDGDTRPCGGCFVFRIEAQTGNDVTATFWVKTSAGDYPITVRTGAST
jgi:hypothetical protein